VFDAGYTFANAWEVGVNWRYDFGENEPTRAGLSLGYVNECVDVEFSLSRRYTSASSLEAATEFGLTASLAGFGAGRDGRSQTRTCNS
jgi:LPS-assembly protein